MGAELFCVHSIIKIFSMLDKLFTFITELFFGIRVEGEPIDLTPPTPSDELPPVDQSFFIWSQEFRVGCQAKNIPIFW